MERGPACQGGSHVARVNFITTRVGVCRLCRVGACRLLSALLSLSQFGRGRLSLVAISFYALSLRFGPCHLSEFTLARPLETHQELTEAGDRGNINFCHECV